MVTESMEIVEIEAGLINNISISLYLNEWKLQNSERSFTFPFPKQEILLENACIMS